MGWRSHGWLVLAAWPVVMAAAGCHTARSWADAGRERSSVARVMGVAPPTRAGGPEQLVVGYRDAGAASPETFYVTVPLEEGGRPAYPFGAAGGATDVAAVVAALPPEQGRAIESAKLAAHGSKQGRGAAAGVRPVSYRGVGTMTEASAVYAIVYRLDDAASAAPVPPPAPDYTPDPGEMDRRRRERREAFRESLMRLSPGEHLLLLPYRQPRPPGMARAAAARAALMTPVTLGMDALEVALLPLGVIGYLVLPH